MTSCFDLFSTSGLKGIELQQAVENCFADGECELVTVSAHSPGPVNDEEKLVRLVFHPIHVNETTGEILPMAFMDAWKSDLSVFRDDRASDGELLLAIEQMKATGLQKSPPQQRTVAAAMAARTRNIRFHTLEKCGTRAFRVYDTAESSKPHHASVFLTKAARAELTEKTTRKRLFELFSSVKHYREGRIA